MSIWEAALRELKAHDLKPFPFDTSARDWRFELNEAAWKEALQHVIELNPEFMAYGGTSQLFGYPVVAVLENSKPVILVALDNLKRAYTRP